MCGLPVGASHTYDAVLVQSRPVHVPDDSIIRQGSDGGYVTGTLRLEPSDHALLLVSSPNHNEL